MASRLSRLSKGKNALAHLDVGLPAAIAGMDSGTGGAARAVSTSSSVAELEGLRHDSVAVREKAVRAFQTEMLGLRLAAVALHMKDENVCRST